MSAQLLHYTLSASLDAGRGLKATPDQLLSNASLPSSDICVGLANCHALNKCYDPLGCLEVMHAREWRSMASVIEGCGLGDSASRSKIPIPAGVSPVTAVDLCRYSSGYLVRLSAGADPGIVAERIEFAAGTRNAAVARLIRNAMYRGFDAIGALPVRSRRKWLGYLRTDRDDPSTWPAASDDYWREHSDHPAASLPTAIIRGLVAAAESSGIDLGPPLHQALDYLAIKSHE